MLLGATLCCLVPARALAETGPIILVYANKGEELYRPSRAASTEREPAAGTVAAHEESLQSQRPLRLRTVDGKVAAAAMPLNGVVAYWGGAAGRGYAGIAIDEFGDPDPRIDAKLASALALTRWRHPHLFIAVWHAGRLSRRLASVYRRYASLVVLEAYSATRDGLSKLTCANLSVARREGILEKTVVGLGVDNADPLSGGTGSSWANTSAKLEAEMDWVRRIAPETPGIALFIPDATSAMRRAALTLAAKSLDRPAERR